MPATRYRPVNLRAAGANSESGLDPGRGHSPRARSEARGLP